MAHSSPRSHSPFTLSVVVPCFNEEAVIVETHARIVNVLGENPNFELELIYVDDGSHDRTRELLLEIAEWDLRVTVVIFTRNFGHQPAVSCGLDYACGDVVAVMDADLQDPPEVILEMLKKWRDGYEVVYGVRSKRKESILRRAIYATYYQVLHFLANVDVPLHSGDFSIIDRRVVDSLKALPEHNRFMRGLRAWVGFRQTGHVYERHARAAGETKYPLRKLIKLGFDGIFNFSTAPLTAIFLIGIAVSGISIFCALMLVIYKITDLSIFGYNANDLPGYTSIVFSIFFFGGVQLISVGILGEYVGRIYTEVKQRPNYIVDRTHGRSKADKQ